MSSFTINSLSYLIETTLSQVYTYIMNTKKPHLDNNHLSLYSTSFRTDENNSWLFIEVAEAVRHSPVDTSTTYLFQENKIHLFHQTYLPSFDVIATVWSVPGTEASEWRQISIITLSHFHLSKLNSQFILSISQKAEKLPRALIPEMSTNFHMKHATISSSSNHSHLHIYI